MKSYFIYILTNYKKTVLYIGLTNDLGRRIAQHKTFQIDGFTKRYKTDTLIYFEEYKNIYEAKLREKRLKAWKRQWKENLINESNPEWNEIMIG